MKAASHARRAPAKGRRPSPSPKPSETRRRGRSAAEPPAAGLPPPEHPYTDWLDEARLVADLRAVGVRITAEDVGFWSPEQRAEAARWAAATEIAQAGPPPFLPRSAGVAPGDTDDGSSRSVSAPYSAREIYEAYAPGTPIWMRYEWAALRAEDVAFWNDVADRLAATRGRAVADDPPCTTCKGSRTSADGAWCVGCGGSGIEPGVGVGEGQGDVLDLDAALGRRDFKPANPAGLPTLSEGDIPFARLSVAELALVALAGARGQHGQTLLESFSTKLADDVDALGAASHAGTPAEALSPLLFDAAERARVLAEMVARAERARATP